MESTELSAFEKRVRARYEAARLKRALLGLSPALLVTALAAWLGDDVRLAIALGAAVFVGGVFLLWYGRDPGRAVLPGVAAGLLPLAFALCTQSMPHGCAGGHCFSTCLPAAAAGGILAGLAVSRFGLRGPHGVVFWLSASGLALLTGAMGCVCVGLPGLGAMTAGYGAGFVVARVSKRRSPT